MTEAGSSALKTAYEGGNLSLRALAREFGISESLVRKKAAAGGWVRTPPPRTLIKGVRTPWRPLPPPSW